MCSVKKKSILPAVELRHSSDGVHCLALGLLSLPSIRAFSILWLASLSFMSLLMSMTVVHLVLSLPGYPAGFWQTAQLVPRLGRAKREGTLDGLLADVAKARLLVLDEFGHVPFDVDGARLPCQAMSESHGRRSVISATNVGSGRWGTVFADDKLAAAIVDHVVHQSGLVEFGGPSHRLEESLMLGKPGR